MHVGFPLPDLDYAQTAGFWLAAERHELAIPRCTVCGAWVWYPEATCPVCSAPDPVWTTMSGRGSLFTWTEVHRALLGEYAAMVPYITAIVALEEDPALRVVTRMVDVAAADLRADMPVIVTFREISFPGSSLHRTAPLFMVDDSNREADDASA